MRIVRSRQVKVSSTSKTLLQKFSQCRIISPVIRPLYSLLIRHPLPAHTLWKMDTSCRVIMVLRVPIYYFYLHRLELLPLLPTLARCPTLHLVSSSTSSPSPQSWDPWAPPPLFLFLHPPTFCNLGPKSAGKFSSRNSLQDRVNSKECIPWNIVLALFPYHYVIFRSLFGGRGWVVCRPCWGMRNCWWTVAEKTQPFLPEPHTETNSLKNHLREWH